MSARQFILPLSSELVIDLFAGGGGASTGIEQAIGRHVDIAVNHDPQAVSLHEANHPQTRHFVSDVFEVDPLAVTDGRPVGMLWASPDCKHFSKAKGGKPVSKKIRGLAWVVVKWAKLVRPRVIFLENVEEFQTWGPLGEDGRPCPQRKGSTFTRWKRQLENLGYVVEHRELRACDYGAPTIRKRLFLVARCDGQSIAWPTPTHGAGLKPYRTAADCIDWTIPAPSIFERTKPLAEATQRRIAHGIKRYVLDNPKPFIVRIGHTGHGDGGKTRPINEPISTITSKAEHLLASPTLIQTGYGERPGQAPRVPGLDKPLGTCVDGQKHAVVAAFLAKHFGGEPQDGKTCSSLERPAPTVTARDHSSLVTANLIDAAHADVSPTGVKRWGKGHRDLREPLPTVVSSGNNALVTSNLVKLRGTSNSADTEAPLATVSAQGTHHAEVRALLLKYYGTDQDPRLVDPLHTVTTKDRFAVVTVHVQEYFVADIGMRMLQPRELYRAQGFPDTYIINRGADGRELPKDAQVRMCGNSVCPPLARVLVAANYAEPIALPANDDGIAVRAA
ncbi:MAG: DNA cytosine methyltransferase [Steroidobacteraceae bacterium]